jgi:hypothetical protein
MEDAAADYHAATALLSRPLPAYVTYQLETRVRMGLLQNAASETIVVRTADGTVLHGKLPADDDALADTPKGEFLTNPPFVPHCYAPQSALDAELDGHNLLAIKLEDRCKKDDDAAFDTLYVDKQTHEAVAATADADDEGARVRLDERFARSGVYVLPASFTVTVRGKGAMAWLDTHVTMLFSAYRFGTTQP